MNLLEKIIDTAEESGRVIVQLISGKEKLERMAVNTSNGQKQNDLNGWQDLKVSD